MSLSDRIRPNCEAAPWVIEEVKRLEADLYEAQHALVYCHAALKSTKSEALLAGLELGWEKSLKKAHKAQKGGAS